MQKDEIKSLKNIDKSILSIKEEAIGKSVFDLSPFTVNTFLKIICNELNDLCNKYPLYNELVLVEELHNILQHEVLPLIEIRYSNQWMEAKKNKVMIDIIDKIDFYTFGILSKIEEAKGLK